MVAILEIPEVRARISTISVAEYHRMGEFNEDGRRTELLRGIVIGKWPKSPLHCAISQRLCDSLSRQVPAGWTVRKEDPLTLRDSEPEPEPDLAVVQAGDYSRAHPSTAALVIEVAVTSPALNRASASMYAEAGVQEYWIVLAERRGVEVYRDPDAGAYRQVTLHAAEEILACSSLPGLAVPVAGIFPKA